MVVHGDDFIVAGDGDDLDWLLHKLNEKHELVQKARLGPGYDSEATVLNRCTATLDSRGKLTRGTRDCQWLSLDYRQRDHRRARAAHSQVHHWTTKKLEPDGQQAYHSVSARLAYLASDRPDITFACKEHSRAVGKATRADLTRLKRIGRYLLQTPRAVWEFPLQQEESIMMIDGLSDADAAFLPENECW